MSINLSQEEKLKSPEKILHKYPDSENTQPQDFQKLLWKCLSYEFMESRKRGGNALKIRRIKKGADP